MTHKEALDLIRRKLVMDHDARKDGTATVDSERIIREVVEAQVSENISNSRLATILRCSTATWSQIRTGKYKGNVSEYVKRARMWLEDAAARHEEPETPYVSTAIASQILGVCKRAAEMPCIGLVIARSGVGKTASLQEFTRRRPHRTVYLQAGEMLASPVMLLIEIAAKLDLPTYRSVRRPQMYRHVRNRLAGLYAGGKADPVCLLIDEATTLRPQALNMLRNLHDDTACRVGLVLADTWRLDGELHSRRGIVGGYEQLLSRSGAQVRMATDQPMRIEDVTRVASSIIAGLGDRRKLPAATCKYLHRLAEAPGGLRNVQHRLRIVHDAAEACGRPAQYSVSELDFIAPLAGGECEMTHTADPFRMTPGRVPARRTA